MDNKTARGIDANSTTRSSTPQGIRFGPYLTGLPHDLLQGLYRYLSISDRLHLARTCSYLYNIHRSSKLLQYQFTLETSAYIDVPPLKDLSTYSRHAQADHSDSDTDSDSGHNQEPSLAVSDVTFHLSVDGFPDELQRRVNAHSTPLEKQLVLKERERRWETIDPAVTRKFRVGGPAGVYELQEGIFLMCDDYSDTVEGRPSSIRLIPLPSAHDPDLKNPIVPLKTHKLDFSIADLTMDPTQDLIVVSEYRPPTADTNHSLPAHRYHLLSLSTFKPHPLAALPILDFPPFTRATMQTRQLLQVMDDTLVILVSQYAIHWLLQGLGAVLPMGESGVEEQIVCWNWKTGRVLARLNLPENGWFASFALLTPTSFMITSTSNISPVMTDSSDIDPNTYPFPPVIRVYSFLPDPENKIIPVQPLGPEHDDDTTARPILVAQLELPRLAPGTGISSFDVRPDPAFPRASGRGVGERKAFTQDPEKGVLVFELSLTEPADAEFGAQHLDQKNFELFVLRETLVSLAKEGEGRLIEQRASRSETTGEYAFWRVERNIPWSEWGEKQSRFMDMSMSRRVWVCSCSGYRFITLVPCAETSDEMEAQHDLIASAPTKSDFRLLDFSPWNLRRPLSADVDDPDATVTTRTLPTILSKEKVWQEDVKTMLPYTEVVKRKGYRANGVMMDDQRVIAVCTRGRRNGDWSNIRQEMTVFCM